TDGPWDRLDYLRVPPDLPQNSNDDEDQDDDEQEVDEVSRPRDGGNARGPEVPQQPEDDQDHDEQLEHVSLRSITRCGDVRSYRWQPTKSTPQRSSACGRNGPRARHRALGRYDPVGIRFGSGGWI